MECAEDKYLWFDTTNNLQKIAASKGIPLMGTFELTPRCNLSCEMCYIRRDASDERVLAEEKTAEEWISLGEQAAKAGTLFLLLTGGEPFLRPDFKKIYQALSKMGFIITIYSNATLLTPGIVEWLSRTPPNKIEITIYGASADTYAAVTGSGRAYKRTLDGISMLLNAGIETRLRTTVIRSNKYDLKNIAKYAEHLGVTFHHSANIIKPVRGAISNANKIRLSPQEVFEVIEPDNSDEIENNEESVKRSIYTENNKVSNEPMFCMGGRCSYWISWNGRMLPCSMMSNPSANPFDLGFGAAWEQTKDNIKYITRPKECDECKYKKYCPACPGRLQSETGNFELISSYICDVAKSQYLKYAK